MKRPLFLILLASVVLVIGYLGYKIVRGNAEKERIAAQIQTLPSFRFTTLEGTTFTEKNIAEGAPILIVHFLPDCHYCQGEVKELARNAHLFAGVEILFVSMAEKQAMTSFSKEYGLDTIKSITFLHDSELSFGKTFGTVSVPTTFAYTKEHRLAKQFSGEASAQALLKVLESGGIGKQNGTQAVSAK
jgi:peroxiredoxin